MMFGKAWNPGIHRRWPAPLLVGTSSWPGKGNGGGGGGKVTCALMVFSNASGEAVDRHDLPQAIGPAAKCSSGSCVAGRARWSRLTTGFGKKAEEEAALAANDDRRNDRQCKVNRRGLTQPALPCANLGKSDDFSLPPNHRGKAKHMEIENCYATLPTADGRLIVCHGQWDVSAVASIVQDASERRELRNWNLVIVATSHCQAVVMVMVRPMRGTIQLRASVAVGRCVRGVAAGTGLRTSVHTARRAVSTNAEIDRITAHGEQLRCHQRQCEDRPRHEYLVCTNSPYEASSLIMVSDQFGAGNDEKLSLRDSRAGLLPGFPRPRTFCPKLIASSVGENQPEG